MDETHERDAAAAAPPPEERTIMVFLRDTERDLGTGYKTRGLWRAGVFDASPWSEGEFRDDRARARIFYGIADLPAGRSRFVVERIVEWDTGETVYSECGYA